MRRFAAVLLALGALVPASSSADHCASDIVVFTGNLFPSEVSGGLATVRDTVEGALPVPWPIGQRIPTQPAWVNSAAVTCDELGHDYDGRLINPGATHFSLRYTADLGADVPTLTAVLIGMGFDGTQQVTLNREEFVLGGIPQGTFLYNSARLPFADPASSDQFIFVAIQLFPDDEVPETNCFHTVIGACPA